MITQLHALPLREFWHGFPEFDLEILVFKVILYNHWSIFHCWHSHNPSVSIAHGSFKVITEVKGSAECVFFRFRTKVTQTVFISLLYICMHCKDLLRLKWQTFNLKTHQQVHILAFIIQDTSMYMCKKVIYNYYSFLDRSKFQLAAACPRNKCRQFRLGHTIEVSASSIYLYIFLWIQKHISGHRKCTNTRSPHLDWSSDQTLYIHNCTFYHKALLKTIIMFRVQLCKATNSLNWIPQTSTNVCKLF